MAFTVVYDANVLYPASLRDLLVRLGGAGLFRAKWTREILDEMVDSLIRDHDHLDRSSMKRTVDLMVKAIPDSVVTGYRDLINTVALPDPDDRHVVAAAIRCNAAVIVTSNLRDFPDELLSPFAIEAQSPDEFVCHLLEIAYDTVVSTVATQAAGLSRPPQSYDQLLDRLAQVGLAEAVAQIREGRPPPAWLHDP